MAVVKRGIDGISVGGADDGFRSGEAVEFLREREPFFRGLLTEFEREGGFSELMTCLVSATWILFVSSRLKDTAGLSILVLEDEIIFGRNSFWAVVGNQFLR